METEKTENVVLALVWDYVNEAYRAYPYNAITNRAVGGSYTVTTTEAKKMVGRGLAHFAS